MNHLDLRPAVKYCPFCGSNNIKHVGMVPRCMHCRAVFMASFGRWARRSPSKAHRKAKHKFLIQPPRLGLAFEPDDDGQWFHPDFLWDLIPEETSPTPIFSEAGYELTNVERDGDFETDQQPCKGWVPAPFFEGGWFLVAVCDSDDGPMATYARPNST